MLRQRPEWIPRPSGRGGGHAASTILAHVGEILPKESKIISAYHQMHDDITDLIFLMDADLKKDISFVREEEKDITVLLTEIPHREWKAVTHSMGSVLSIEKKAIRLEMQELIQIHREIELIVEKIEAGPLKPYLTNRFLILYLPKKDHAGPAIYYLTHLHKMFKAYDRILRDLMMKERKLNKSLKHIMNR